jgi:prepilin-type N-terminal cleavage/methylation domain-containing protein
MQERNGYTIVEMLVTIVIFTVLLMALYFMFSTFYRQQQNNISTLRAMENANRLMGNLGRELRQANRAENGNYILATVTAQTLSFYSDVDQDGSTEKVTYAFSGTDLRRTVVEPGTGNTYAGAGTTTTVCTGVQNGSAAIFTYYDKSYLGSGSALTLPVNAPSVVTVGAVIDLRPLNKSTPLHFETKIHLRNY